MFKRHVSNDDLITFYQELEQIVRNDMPIDEGMRQLSVRKNGAIARLAEVVEKKLSMGHSLHEAVAECAGASPYAVALLKAGEEGDLMGDALRDIVLMYRRQRVAKRTYAQAVRYPLFVLMIFSAVVVFISFTLMPRMEDIYNQMYGQVSYIRIPITNSVLLVGRSIRENLVLYLGLIGILIIGYPWLRRDPRIRMVEHNILLRVPVIGRVIFYDSMGRFCQVFGQMLRRGVPVDAALMLAAGGVDSFISMKLAGRMSKTLGQGGSLSRGMADSQLFAPIFVWMVQKAEERGDAAGAFIDLSEFYEEKFKDASGMIGVLMEPVLLIFVGVFLLWFLAGLYLPMFNFTHGMM